MKKSMKISMMAALSISALTPVASMAAQQEQLPTGFYNIETGEVLSVDSILFASNEEKLAIITNPNFYFIDEEGNAIKATALLTAKSDSELNDAIQTVEEVEKEHDVVFTPDGVEVKPEVPTPPVETEPAITKAALTVGGNTIDFTDIVGANATLDLSSMDPKASATEATVTASTNSTLTLVYGEVTKSLELTKGQQTVTPESLEKPLNANTPLTVEFLQKLAGDKTELKIGVTLTNNTGVSKTTSGTLTIKLPE